MAKSKRKNSKSRAILSKILVIFLFISAVLFPAMTVVVAIGMIPTIVAAIVDRNENRVKALTVGAINFAGCAPFMVEVFKKGNDLATAMMYITKPRTIVIMYFAAAMGYAVDWAMTGIVASIVKQRAKGRLKDIETTQGELITRWGPEVTGTISLDEFGFPKENFAQKTAE